MILWKDEAKGWFGAPQTTKPLTRQWGIVAPRSLALRRSPGRPSHTYKPPRSARLFPRTHACVQGTRPKGVDHRPAPGCSVLSGLSSILGTAGQTESPTHPPASTRTSRTFSPSGPWRRPVGPRPGCRHRRILRGIPERHLAEPPSALCSLPWMLSSCNTCGTWIRYKRNRPVWGRPAPQALSAPAV